MTLGQWEGRYYDPEIFSRAVKNLRDKIRERQMFGLYFDHTYPLESWDFRRRILNVSHVVAGIQIQGKDVYIDIDILDTERGQKIKRFIRDIKTLEDGGVRPDSLPRLRSNLQFSDSDGSDGNRITKDFKIISFDLVAEPGEESVPF